MERNLPCPRKLSSSGASIGFGRLTANALAKAGHTVYASMQDTTGYMVFGPAEAFTPEQLAELYDINVLSSPAVFAASGFGLF